MIIGFFSQTTALGGSEVYLRALIGALDYQRYSVVFFCNSRHPLLKDQGIKSLIYRDSLRVVCTRYDPEPAEPVIVSVPCEQLVVPKKRLLLAIPPSFRLFLGTIKETLRLIKLFRANPVEILHFNDTGCEPPVIAARLAGVTRVVGTYHVLPDDKKSAMTWVHRLTEWLSVRSMNVGIAVSAATKTAWKERTGVSADRIKVIYNGINFASFEKEYEREVIKRELSIADARKIVGVPARLHAMKGHQYLLEAIKKIVRNWMG